MKKIALFSFTAILIVSCNKSEITSSLKTDTLLQNYYTNEEIGELEKIVSYVDSIVIQKTGENDVNKAYHIFFEDLNSEFKERKGIRSIINENDKYAFLESLDPNVFNSMWRIDKNFNQLNYRDTVLNDFAGIRLLSIQPFDKYHKYLKSLGETDSVFRDIAKSIELAGDISASFFYGYPQNHSKFDFGKIENRLFAAVFILRVEDNIYLKLDRYFENSNAAQEE